MFQTKDINIWRLSMQESQLWSSKKPLYDLKLYSHCQGTFVSDKF